MTSKPISSEDPQARPMDGLDLFGVEDLHRAIGIDRARHGAMGRPTAATARRDRLAPVPRGSRPRAALTPAHGRVGGHG